MHQRFHLRYVDKGHKLLLAAMAQQILEHRCAFTSFAMAMVA
jgi:hypothetical protein